MLIHYHDSSELARTTFQKFALFQTVELIRLFTRPSIKVTYKRKMVGEYFADIVVENRVILELKSVDHLQKIHEAQILNYLKATPYEIGMLVNFTYPKAQIKRFIL